jgi:hypothetical protein
LKSVIVIKGGLGNQLFQYAFYKYVKQFINKNVFIDKSWYINQNLIDTKREFLLDKYLINTFSDNENNFSSFKKNVNSRLENLINFLYKRNFLYKFKYYNGYWQDIFFAKYLTVNDFKNNSFEKINFLDKEYLVVHGRFSDFDNSQLHYTLDKSYYEKALEKFKYPIKIYAISDDEERMKKITNQLSFEIEFVKLDELNAFKLIYNAKGGVASNSTFCWWPVYLSKNSNWVFPKFLLKKKTIYKKNLYIENTKVI